MKKRLSIILALVLFGNFLLVFPVKANNTELFSEEVCAVIRNELALIESCKSSYGMENVEFSDLYIGETIYVYEYLKSGLKQKNKAYPVFYKEEIVTLFYEIDEFTYQIMPSLAIAIQEKKVNSCALIYDAKGGHLYDGKELYPLTYSDYVAERQEISAIKEEELKKVCISDFSQTKRLDYVSNLKQARTQANYVLNVGYVPQYKYDICWAATIATIVNYVQGRSLTAVNVAKAKFGSDYDQGLSTSEAIAFMNSKYNMSYIYSSSLMPSDDVILSNIQSGYPLYGRATVYSNLSYNGHAVTIHGINVVAGRIMVMDSNFGSTTAYARNEEDSTGVLRRYYDYVNPNDNSEVSIYAACCRYWW